MIIQYCKDSSNKIFQQDQFTQCGKHLPVLSEREDGFGFISCDFDVRYKDLGHQANADKVNGKSGQLRQVHKHSGASTVPDSLFGNYFWGNLIDFKCFLVIY